MEPELSVRQHQLRGVIFVFPPKKPTVKVGDTWVFTGEWTMEQMQALQHLHNNNVNRVYLCYGLTAVSLLLSLAALVIAIV